MFVYLQVINFEFVSFDDGGYYSKNETIQNLDFNSIKEIFSSFYKGNYHPLTTLTYAIEWKLFGDKSEPLHALNLIIHLS